jgi:site-specific DNA-methyltransferase (adenine-specific)
LFCDAETMFVAKPAGERAGFKFWKPIVWDKKKIGMGYHYRARYEFVLFFEKGKRKLNDLGVSDIIEAPRVFNGYPTEKPVSVSEVLVAQSSVAGEVVADPFMGSGSVGAAAVGLGRESSSSTTAVHANSKGRSRPSTRAVIAVRMASTCPSSSAWTCATRWVSASSHAACHALQRSS